MNRIYFVAIMLLAPALADAALCSKAPAGQPCTPVPGEVTKAAKKRILENIEVAQLMEGKVKKLEAAYRALRDAPGSSAADKFAACESYRAKRLEQDRLYKSALNETEALYHVSPRDKYLTIARPSDPALGYVKDVATEWDPRATDSGRDELLAIKIYGSDGKIHYGGGAMDPDDTNGTRAATFEDGTTVILKYSFKEALDAKNPGFLAHLLYHESKHFEQLDRPATDGSGDRRGWASVEEDERDAYRADVRMGRVFGLTKKQIDGMRQSLKIYEDLVATNQLSRMAADPKKEALRAEYYEHRQINLESEYESLKKAVAGEKIAQKKLLLRQEEERLAREKAHREELARQAEEREKAEREELALRDKQTWRLIEAEALQCGYEVSFQGHSGNFLGFERQNEYLFFRGTNRPALDVDDLRIMLLVGNTCSKIQENVMQAPPPACNDSASVLHARASRGEYPAKLDAMFGSRSNRSSCVNEILDRAGEIGDTPAFNRFAASYQKVLKKAAEKEAKEARKKRREKRREPSGGERSSPPDDANYRWDPLCNCRVRIHRR